MQRRAIKLTEITIWLLGLLLSSCVDSYAPEVIQSTGTFLVVDGFINSRGVTTIKLSRTLSLTDTTHSPSPEANALVWVEDETGAKFFLTQKSSGTYLSDYQTLDSSRKYRLIIKTIADQEYASAFVIVRSTPEIDDVTWKVENNGVQLYVNTHDSQNNTRYYRWEYTDTWEFTSLYNSVLSYENDSVLQRSDDIYHCWQDEPSARIEIGNTLKLSQDVIAQYPLHFIPGNSVKLRYRYSILVKQYAQTPEEYQYWELLQKNTEAVGNLTDPLPSRLTGNISCVSHPDEPVIGYIGACSVAEKRIFINKEDLPEAWTFDTGYSGCDAPIPIFLDRDNIQTYLREQKYLPLYPLFSPSPFSRLIGYMIASRDCTDCRLRGTNVKPAYWP